jgi:hypothetical protein
MKEKIEKLCLRILFGKSALNGYYVPPKEKVSKNYVFDSVFPNYESMKFALGQESD